MATRTLDDYLLASGRTAAAPDVAAVVRALSTAAVEVNAIIRSGASGRLARPDSMTVNGGGDVQSALDVEADEAFLAALRGAPVRCVASEERHAPVILDATAGLALAIDPLDGSSNIDVNMTIGTIFSILPAIGEQDLDPATIFLQSGDRQLAAGFFVYGPQLALILTVGDGTHLFVHSSTTGAFHQSDRTLGIAAGTREFAVNASNYRHWDEAVRLYVDDCLKGGDGPRGKDFNMRWVASLVAETFRILVRGGVFLYPGDSRPGFGRGRLRLVYEASPIAFLVEQAGGEATDTVERILAKRPESLHQRVPFVFGSAEEVAQIRRYHTEPSTIAERSPLFGNRGLFRA